MFVLQPHKNGWYKEMPVLTPSCHVLNGFNPLF